MSRRNKILAVTFIVGCIVIIGVAAMVRVVSRGNFGNDDVMCNGVIIDGIDVSGMTKEEAQSAVDSHINEITSRTVKIIINDDVVETTFAELGLSSDGSDYVSDAFEIGKTGNFIERMLELGSVSAEDTTYSLKYTVDENMVKDFVKEKCTVFDVKVKNSKLKYKNGKFKATKERVGQKLLINDTVDRILSAIDGNIEDESVEVDAAVKITEPKYTREMVSKCKDLIGSYSTSFATSTAARANNVQTAANYINGTVLYPGKTFSTIKVIKDRTEANGYQSAPEYSSGKVVDGIGGGVCQVSTTLYNAVLNAELKVVERSPHSMVVAYVDVSRDAAISGDYKDFKFKNNTNAPVYIAASAEGGFLSFKIYGEETRPENRKIEFQSEILETIQPGEDIITEDKTLPASYRAVTQSAHVGYRAKLWKIVYIDGVQSEKIEVNTSTYSAEPQYVTVGNQGEVVPSPTPAPTDDAKSTDKPNGTSEPQKTGKPKKTTEPKATIKPKATVKPNVTKKPDKTSEIGNSDQ